MTASHTPGPWTLSKDGCSERKNQANCIHGFDGTLIVYGQANDPDARLIAAAPDLLSSAVELLAASEFSAPTVDHDEAMLRYGEADHALREAIAKAKGVTE
jgi:hypothetical protein